MWVFGQSDLETFLQWVPNMTLDAAVEKITVPYLITHNSNDRHIPLEAAHHSYDQATAGPKRELPILTPDDGGVSADNMEPVKSFIAEWIADTFMTFERQRADAIGRTFFLAKL